MGVVGDEFGERDVGEESQTTYCEETVAELLGLNLGGEAPHEPRR
jgi:hypothetical protein